MKTRSSWRIMITSFLPGTMLSGFRGSSFSSVLFQMSRDLGLSGLESGVISSVQSSAGTIFGIAGGIVTDRFGIKKMFNIGIWILAVGLFLVAFAVDFYSLLVIAFFASIGLTIYVPPLFKFLASLFTDKQRGLALGILALVVRLSAASTFLIVPVVLEVSGSWRYVFLLLGSTALIVALVLHFQLRKVVLEDPPPTAAGRFSARSDLKHILKSRNVVLTAISRVFLSGSSGAISAFLPFLLQLTGTSLVTASLVGTTFWLSQGAGVVLVPRISDVINRRVILVSILSPLAAFLVLGMALSWGSIIITFLITASLGFIFSGLVEVTFLIPLADPQIRSRYAGGATGLLTTIGGLGGIVSTLVVGSLIDISKQNVWPILSFVAALQFLMGLTSFFMKEVRIEQASH